MKARCEDGEGDNSRGIPEDYHQQRSGEADKSL